VTHNWHGKLSESPVMIHDLVQRLRVIKSVLFTARETRMGKMCTGIC